jgi:hypothetical protein
MPPTHSHGRPHITEPRVQAPGGHLSRRLRECSPITENPYSDPGVGVYLGRRETDPNHQPVPRGQKPTQCIISRTPRVGRYLGN